MAQNQAASNRRSVVRSFNRAVRDAYRSAQAFEQNFTDYDNASSDQRHAEMLEAYTSFLEKYRNFSSQVSMLNETELQDPNIRQDIQEMQVQQDNVDFIRYTWYTKRQEYLQHHFNDTVQKAIDATVEFQANFSDFEHANSDERYQQLRQAGEVLIDKFKDCLVIYQELSTSSRQDPNVISYEREWNKYRNIVVTILQTWTARRTELQQQAATRPSGNSSASTRRRRRKNRKSRRN